MDHYSVVIGYFRFKRLWRNQYITRYRVVELRCLLENIIICLYKYLDLASKFLIKMHARKEPPSYRFTSTPLLSFYVREMLTSCWPPLPEIARPPLQSSSWKILNMDNESYSKLMDISMYLSKVTHKLIF